MRLSNKFARLFVIVLTSTALACGGQSVAPQPPQNMQAVQANGGAPRGGWFKHYRYKLIDMGTFGGPTSGESSLNSSGSTTAVGWSATPFDQNRRSNRFICGGSDNNMKIGITHAFRWRAGRIVDLGSLAGKKFCSIAAQARPNVRGWAVGQSEINGIDPALGFNQSRAVLWPEDNRTVDLGSFGGNQNDAFDINDRGEVTGFSLNTVPDQYSLFDYAFFGSSTGTQTRAFMWQRGRMRDLGTLGSGNDAIGWFINRRGQISGISYTNTTPNSTTGVPTVDPFFWE